MIIALLPYYPGSWRLRGLTNCTSASPTLRRTDHMEVDTLLFVKESCLPSEPLIFHFHDSESEDVKGYLF